jgi:hypothetical protein
MDGEGRYYTVLTRPPTFSILNRPHLVPTSPGCRSSTRLTMVVPTVRAIMVVAQFCVIRRREDNVVLPEYVSYCQSHQSDVVGHNKIKFHTLRSVIIFLEKGRIP